MNPKEQKAYDEAMRRIAHYKRMGGKAASLSLFGMGLTVLPPEIGDLTALKELRLGNNSLTTLPREIGQLSSLTRLYLHDNQLTSVPETLGQLSSLRELYLFGNQLTSIPETLGQLSSLTELYLNNNQLTNVPETLGQLSSLTGLYLDGNQLTSVPETLGQLSSLTHLFLHNSQLTSVPETLGQLTKLELLNLEGNALRELPESMRGMTSLRELTLHGNDALGLPVELLGPRWRESDKDENPPAKPAAILDYYFSRREQGGAAMKEVRLLLVGRGRVGKTSLLRVLRGEKPRDPEPETPGITVLPLPLQCGKGSATAHAWDFGGQEFLHGTHQIFLSKRCVYVLVLEGRDDRADAEADYWLRFTGSFGGESPVIVALNKYDEHNFTVNRFKMREQCPQIAGFVETDAFTGRGMAELRAMIKTTVNAMPDVWEEVAMRWHTVKEKLTKMPESYLEYADYQKLCNAEGVTDAGQQDSLAETLHRLGIALNFRDHHRLRHTSVLKPQWVTNGIYGLLRYAKDKDCRGVLQVDWIGKALDAKEYPVGKHDFVMELMEKFEVAFPLEKEGTGQREQPQQWLIPELLPKDQPRDFAEFKGPEVTRLRYFYPDALPPGLLPRLIVRTHMMSANDPQARWRDGVVLEWGECKALVRLDRNERRTEVAVLDCPPDERRNLFDIIRAHLLVLHGNVRAIEEVEMEGHPDSWVRVDKLRKLELKETTKTEEATKEGDLATVPVESTLDRVEGKDARKAAGPDAPKRMRLFVSYANTDERTLKPLGEHLTLLGQNGYIQHWDDTQLIAGEAWEERILEELKRADIVLVIYSTASRGSKFIREKEVLPALAKHGEGKCEVVVVPLNENEFHQNNEMETALGKLQAATRKAKQVLDFKPQREGWKQVRMSIEKAVEILRGKRP